MRVYDSGFRVQGLGFRVQTRQGREVAGALRKCEEVSLHWNHLKKMRVIGIDITERTIVSNRKPPP